ncbi:MAG: hypothetical protein CL569_04540 [Alphaproteobacteria bacterium]|nr:hypothetical protein [Alphaproteobacteria bacterium]
MAAEWTIGSGEGQGSCQPARIAGCVPVRWSYDGPWPQALRPLGDGRMSREELEKRLAVLREGFRDDLGQRLEDISAAWATIQDAGWNDENTELLERLSHSLAGAAATFGFEEISEAARALERVVEALSAGEPPGEDALSSIADLLTTLESSTQQA